MVTRIPPKPLSTGNRFAEPSLIPQQIFPTHVNSGIWKPPNQPNTIRRIRVTSPAKKATVSIEDMLPALPPDLPLPRFLVKQMRKM